MTPSVLDLFSIGIGPSSSHTVGPMRAACLFAQSVEHLAVTKVTCELYGSLALTGKGHGTDEAIILGLSGWRPESIEEPNKHLTLVMAREAHQINLGQKRHISFTPSNDIHFLYDQKMPLHSNGLIFYAYADDGSLVHRQGYYSVGGGFICDDQGNPLGQTLTSAPCPYPFASAHTLVQLCQQHDISISELMWQNERTWNNSADLKKQLLALWKTMAQSIERGLTTNGVLPGGLKVKRRAPQIYQKLLSANNSQSKTAILDWLSAYAMAVNEENAAGGRVVTAPTNGAAGIIPAVLQYCLTHLQPYQDQTVIDFLLTAGAIGILYKEGASLSAAEVGCQGEVGVACSMAAGALTAVLGGTVWQIENAAEIGMEHNLGLTCDPIGGLVQIPCIERNTMGAVKAVNAAFLALNSDGRHLVSLDKVIATMLRTGKDMQHQYKETSLGGLAIQVNMPEC